MPGIITGIILAIGRIVGESAALLFTAGSGYLLPKTFAGFFKKIFESGGTLTIQLYLSMSKAQYDAAFGIAAVLLIIVLFINLLTKILAKKFDVSKLDYPEDNADAAAPAEWRIHGQYQNQHEEPRSVLRRKSRP